MHRRHGVGIAVCALVVAGLLLFVGVVPRGAVAPHHGGGGSGNTTYTSVSLKGCANAAGWNTYAYNVDFNGDGVTDSAMFFFEGYYMKIYSTTGPSPWYIYQVTSPARSFNLWEVVVHGYKTNGKCDSFGFDLTESPLSTYQTVGNPAFMIYTELGFPNGQAVTLTCVSGEYPLACPPGIQPVHGLISGYWAVSSGTWTPTAISPQFITQDTSWAYQPSDFAQDIKSNGYPVYPLAYWFGGMLPKNPTTASSECLQSPIWPIENLDVAHNPAYPSEGWPFYNTVDIPPTAFYPGDSCWILQLP